MTKERSGKSASTDDQPPGRITTWVTYRIEAVVLRVAGDIDLSTAAKFETAIDAVLMQRPRAVIIDLSAVEFLGSVGLKLLIQANEKAEIPGRFAIVADSPATRRPIELTDLDGVFSLYTTLDDALHRDRHP
jgi:anti-sigma B factor antagonist